MKIKIKDKLLEVVIDTDVKIEIDLIRMNHCYLLVFTVNFKG